MVERFLATNIAVMGSPGGDREIMYVSVESYDHSTDVDFPSSVAENRPRGISQLVTGRDHSLRERSQNDRERLKKVQKNLKSLNERFASLVTCVQRDIRSESTKDVKTYVISLSTSFKEDHLPDVNSTTAGDDASRFVSEVPVLFEEQVTAINSAPDVTSIFSEIAKYGLWDSLNYDLLESITKMFCSHNAGLLDSMKEYSEAVEKFKKETLLRDYLDIWRGRSSLYAFKDASVIVMKVKGKYSTYTLQRIAEEEINLESTFHFRRFLLNFANANRGCVQIVWLVPDRLIQYLKQRVMSMPNKVSLSGDTVQIPGQGDHVFKVSFQKTNFQQEQNRPKTYGYALGSVKSLLEKHDNFDTLYKMSIDDPETFWGILALEFLQWMEPFQKVMDCDMREGKIRWFTEGKLNISMNCVDRHAKRDPDRVALVWVKDTEGNVEKVSFQQLLKMVCQIANALKGKGVAKGDRVAIYMPVCPLAVASMLACTRIGAVHNVLFSRFNTAFCKGNKSEIPLKERIANAKVIITANEAPYDNGQVLPLKKDVDCVLDSVSDTKFVLVAQRTETRVNMIMGRDYNLEEAMAEQSTECDPEPMDSEDDLFIIYTSGSTGAPKGVVHTQAGYLLHVAVTHKYYFGCTPDDIYACVADIGWITGHSYVVYGPLCNGTTTVLLETSVGSHLFSVIERLGINQFYVTPSNIRTFMIEGEDAIDCYALESLKVIGSVGESLSSDAYWWFHDKVGKKRCHVIDTWWQTELGGIAMAPPCVHDSNIKAKPGPMKPSFGVIPVILNDQEQESQSGRLFLQKVLPGMGRRLLGERSFKTEYFSQCTGLYFTSDVASRNSDGDYLVIGRIEDVIRVGDIYLNLPLIEETLSKCHKAILEASVVMPKSDTEELTVCVSVTDDDQGNTEPIAAKVREKMRVMTGNYALKVYITKSGIKKTLSGKVVKYALREIEQRFRHELGTGDIKAYYYEEELSRIANEDYDVKNYVF